MSFKRPRIAKKQIWVDILLVVVIVIVAFPLIWILITSLKVSAEIAIYPPTILFKPTLENFHTVFVYDNFLKYFRDSTIIALLSSFISLYVGCLAAYSIDRFGTGGKYIVVWTLLIRMLPPVAIILPVYVMIQRFRLLDTYFSIVMMHTLMNLPFVVLLMRGFFHEVPKSIDEASMIDGCSLFCTFYRVILPIVLPGILATAVFCLITSWNEFLFSLVLCGTKITTVPVAASFYVTDRDILWGPVAAVGVSGSIPIIVFTMLIQKHLVRGMTYGAIK